MVSLSYYFPGFTPTVVWGLTFDEWLLYATSVDALVDANSKQQTTMPGPQRPIQRR